MLGSNGGRPNIFGRRKYWFLALLLLGLVLRPTETRAQTATKTVRAETYAEARSNAQKIGAELLSRGIPGLALAVAVNGTLVYSEGFGFADLEQRVPTWPTTKFRIGSISKPLTAAAFVELIESGKVDPDAPVQKYVPSFPDKGAKITPRMLAGHLGGIRHYKDNEFEINTHYESVLDGLKVFENDPLVAAPGTKFNYSSYGFNLLSAVIESASGENFLVYMQNHVFTALGLVDTTADQNRLIVAQRSRFYDRDNEGTLHNSPYVDNSYKWAGGGFISTAEDLVKFGSALLRPGFLKESSLKLLFTSQKTIAGEETHYGMGWGIRKSKSGKLIYEHSGGSVGGTSQLILYPETNIVVALVTNYSNGGWKIDDVQAIGEAFENKSR